MEKIIEGRESEEKWTVVLKIKARKLNLTPANRNE